MNRTKCLLLCVATAVSILPVRAAAQEAAEQSRAARAVRLSAAPTIDGSIDEDAWEAAAPFDGFVQHEPREGEAPTERTEVRIGFDDKALYIAARLYDSSPGDIIVGERRRDAALTDTDSFLILLDTYRDRHSAFVFGTTPAAIEVDGQIAQESGQASGSSSLNLNWDGSWEVATSRDAGGWSAEFRIPFSTLRYAPGEKQTWGVNFARNVRRKNEQIYWSPVPRNFDIYRVSLAGALEGLEPPVQRLFTITPYVLGSAQRDYIAASTFDYPFEVGGDAKIGLTQSLTLDVTYNTDFAQVEADEQQVNLTRFNISFPEKRPFFLENAGLFQVGTRGTTELFFSRQIGISDETVVPILGGARVTGKIAGMSVGVLDIQTDRVRGLLPTNNFGVARIVKDLPNRSRIGAIFVSRYATGQTDDYNRAYGVDGRLGIGDALSLDAFAAVTETPQLTGRDYAYTVRSDLSTRAWRGNFGVSAVGEDFNPEVGFLTRSGYRNFDSGLYRIIRGGTKLPWLRDWQPHFNFRNHYDFDGFMETGYLHLDNDINFSNGAHISAGRNRTVEGLKEPFEIYNGIVVAPGVYTNWIWDTTWRSDPSAPLSGQFNLTSGGFLSGTRRGGGITLTARRGATFTTSLKFRYDKLDLREGSFSTTLTSLRLAYAFTPRIYLQSLIQYSDRTRALSGNVRFGWLNTAGTGLFLVLNETQGTGWADHLGERPSRTKGPLARGVVLKFTRQFDIGR